MVESLVWLGNSDSFILAGGYIQDTNKKTALLMLEYNFSKYSIIWVALADYGDNTNPNVVSYLHSPAS